MQFDGQWFVLNGFECCCVVVFFGVGGELYGGVGVGDDVIGEDFGQVGFVFGFDQGIDGVCWQFVEGGVGGCKDGEGVFVVEGVDQIGGFYGGD